MGQQVTRLLWGSEEPEGREKATWLQMAIDSSKSKMTVKDLAGGQGNFVNSKHRK